MTHCPKFKLIKETEGFYALVDIQDCCGNCVNWDWWGQKCHKEEKLKERA